MPAMVSTFPFIPFGAFGVFTGSAATEPEEVRQSAHFVPNIFCALPTDTVALARRCVTSTWARTFRGLKALSTPLRTDDVAPYLPARSVRERYLPYADDAGLLADFAFF